MHEYNFTANPKEVNPNEIERKPKQFIASPKTKMLEKNSKDLEEHNLIVTNPKSDISDIIDY
jgi:hypothetical protein